MRNSPFRNGSYMLKLIAIFLITFGGIFHHQVKPEIIAEPIPLFQEKIQQDYLAPASEYAAGHRGLDILVELGEQLLSPVEGQITFADKLVDRDVITVTAPDGKRYSFEPACPLKTLGATVTKGEPIATHCLASDSYKYHCDKCVHFSARSDFGYLSPLYLLGRLEPSVLSA